MEGAPGVEAATLNRVVEEASWLCGSSRGVCESVRFGSCRSVQMEPTRRCPWSDMERQRSARYRERLLQLEKARGVGIGSRATRFGGNVDVGAANEVHRDESIEAGASV